MKTSIKNKLKKQNLLIGSWITIPDLNIVEIFSNNCFDWLCIDMEHSSITIKDIPMLTSLIEKNNISPLVRLGENNSNLIKRVMDCGAHGVIIADIKNALEAQKAINSVKYPPLGNRGVGLYKAQGYGKDFNHYLKWLKNESVVILQIESLEAVADIDNILSIKNLDAIMIGPYDLSGSMGITGNFDDIEFKKTLKYIINKSKKHSISVGIHSISTNPKDLKKYIKQGFNFIACSLDTIFLSDSVSNYVKNIK